MNIKNVINLWANNKPGRAGNVSTDGNVLYSYRTVIARKRNGKAFVLNAGAVSVTTSKHSNWAAAAVQDVVRVSSFELET